MSKRSKEWAEYRLEELATMQGGGTPSRSISAYFGGGIPWVTPTDLKPPGLVEILTDTAESLTGLGLAKSSGKLVPKGSVLFSSRATIGKIAITDKACATNQGFVNFTPNTEKVDAWFLAFLLCRYTEEIKALSGKTTFLEVSRGKLRAFLVKVPNLQTQQKIVAKIQECLGRVDEIERLRRESISERKQLPRSFYHDTYNGLLRIHASRKLGTLGTVCGGGTPSKANAAFWLGNIPWISPRDMKRNSLYDSALHVSKAAIEGSAAKLIPANSVLFVVRGMILAHTLPVAINRVDAAINQDMKAIIPGSTVTPDFLATMLRGAERCLLSKTEIAGHGTRRLQTEHWASVQIPVPPLDEQQDIMTKVAAIESVSDALADDLIIQDVALLRDAILRKAFAGEL